MNKLTLHRLSLLLLFAAPAASLAGEVLFVGDIYLQGTDPPELVFRYEGTVPFWATATLIWTDPWRPGRS